MTKLDLKFLLLILYLISTIIIDHFIKGIQVNSPVGAVTAHAMLIQCSAELIARASIVNMKNFNGQYGCLYCLSPGKTTATDHLHRFWPHDPSGHLRTTASFKEDGMQALLSGKTVRCSILAIAVTEP